MEAAIVMTGRSGPNPFTISKTRDLSVDSKLLHVIRKLVASVPYDNGEQRDLDHVVNCLCTQHREYQRKDREWLNQQVKLALDKLESTRKRKNWQDDEEEKEYDKQAAERDKLFTEQGNNSMLNATLRNRYRQQQETLQIQRQSSVLEDEAKVSENASNEGTNAEMVAVAVDSTPSTSKENATPIKDKRVKRRKTNISQTSSRNLNGLNPFDNDASAFLVTPVPRPRERYDDLGGMEDVLQQIRQLVEYPLVRPEVYRHLGVDPPRGVLLRGPPGCGKTHLANAIAGQLGIPYFRVSSPELVSGMSGESESRIRDLFKAASDLAPSIIFMDELDAIAPKRSEGGGNRGMEKRMVAQLLTCMDRLDPQYNRNNATVVVLGATNRPDAMDSALRRAGRFDKEIMLGVPDELARQSILRTMTKEMRLSGDFDYKVLARKIPGYVGADVRSLTKEAAVIAINRIFRDVLKDHSECSAGTIADGASEHSNIASVTPFTVEQMEPLFVTMDDFLAAIPLVQPSSKREGFATVPGVTWNDIGALQCVREELTLSVLEPIRNPEKFEALGLPLPAGVLLYGPPGCGKTLLAKAIAHESGTNFISVKGPELLDKYVGESERAVRLVFERARSSSPCVVFFDELDSLCPRRGSDGGGGGVSERVVNQLLTEMDGLESRRGVFVIAATNRPELIDPAMMRPYVLHGEPCQPIATQLTRRSPPCFCAKEDDWTNYCTCLSHYRKIVLQS
jgi:ribosome biogenesis ATPase